MAHVGGTYPHIADARMEGSGFTEKDQRLFAIVLEFGAAVDVAQKQTDDVGRVRKLKRVGFGRGNAIANTVRVAANMKLLKTTKWKQAPPLADGQHDRLPPQGGAAASKRARQPGALGILNDPMIEQYILTVFRNC
ncbi:MAG: hypothetical protein WA858_20175 [Xanthobacteraceae bacterium]